jgi:hypothetical protein
VPLALAPVLDGVTMPRPSQYRRTPVAVAQDRELSGGTIARYSRGHRFQHVMSWELAQETAALLLEQLGRIRGVTQFVDMDGTPYVVLVDDFDGLEPIAGTAPVRYKVSLSLKERRPR